MTEQDKLLKAITAAAILGFQRATSTNLTRQLYQYRPEGATALRDAVQEGTAKMLALQAQFVNSVLAGQYTFVHVILTDGEDTSSKISQYSLKSQLQLLSARIPRELLRTIYIGVGLSYSSQSSLKDLAQSSNGDFYNIQDNEIESLFQRITLQLGIVTRKEAIMVANDQAAAFIMRQQQQLFIQAKEHKYLIMFTMDGSGSMSGSRWRQVCNAVSNFVSNLGEDDLVSAIIFNNEAKCITEPPAHDQRQLASMLVNSASEVEETAQKGSKCSMLIQLILCVLCTVYAATVETTNQCYASNDSDQPLAMLSTGAVNVSERYQTLLIFLACTYGLDILRSLCVGKQNIISSLLCLNFIVQLAAIILLHIWRLNHAGQVCSGNLSTDEFISQNPDMFLLMRGQLLLGLLYFYWVSIGFVILLVCLICAAKALT